MALSVSIELVSSSARVTSVKSTKGVSVTDGHPDTKIGPGTPGSDKKVSGLFELSVPTRHNQNSPFLIDQKGSEVGVH